MARPSKRDLAFIEASRAELSVLRLDAPETWHDWLEALRVHSGAALTSVHRIALHGAELGVDFEISADDGRGFGAGLRRTLDVTAPATGILYDPTRPARTQRNVVLTPHRDVLGVDAPASEAIVRLARECRFDLAGQVRALICDGPLLLAWVGGAWPAEDTERGAHLLRALLPSLQRRLVVDRALGHATLHAAALQASLEALAVPAFLVVRRFGRQIIELANSAGVAALEHDPTQVIADLDESRGLAPSGGAFRLVAVETPGCAPATLAIARAPVGAAARVKAAEGRFGLTRRQREVLELVLLGHTNRTIGECLRCTEGTVEQHVTALLDKVGADTRSQLVARIWSDPDF